MPYLTNFGFLFKIDNVMDHKIKKIRVYPKEPIEWNNGVYLGMSMNNKMFKSAETIAEMLKLIGEHTHSFTLLIGDYLHRYNEQIFLGYDEAEAIEKSIEKGVYLTSLFKSVAKNYSVKYDLRYSSEFKERSDFLIRLEKFKQLYQDNNRFHELINDTVNIFLRRQSDIKISIHKAKELCRSYLFEELIIFEMLAEEGLNVNIYPGNQLPLIKVLVSGKLNNVSEKLENIQAIEIKFRPS